jgi:hypothetical protein
MNQEEIDNKFDDIDKKVFEVLEQYIPDHSDIAIDTYKFGLLLRQIAIDNIEKNESRKNSRLYSIVKNETFSKIAILIAISAVKFGYTPIVKILTRR